MSILPRCFIFLAMLLLTFASMWTTYVSLSDSILPEPTIDIQLGHLGIWECSVIALGLSIAIGLMLFALKVAIIEGERRLNVFGILGMTIVAFISITFNMDVLYRTADQDFYLRYSTAQMKDQYASFLTDVRTELVDRRQSLMREVAAQEGELESEILGLREAPEGYGPRAREEEYRLTLLERTTRVDLEAIEEALESQREAATLLSTVMPASIGEIQELQDELRVAVKDAAAVAGKPLPEAVQTDNPLFAVFGRLFDFQLIGWKEILILLIAFFLDLGDIIGYSLIPGRPKRQRQSVVEAHPLMDGPEVIPGGNGRESRAIQPYTGGREYSSELVREATALEPQIRRPSRASFWSRK